MPTVHCRNIGRVTSSLEIREVNSRFINMVDVMGQGLAYQHNHNQVRMRVCSIDVYIDAA